MPRNTALHQCTSNLRAVLAGAPVAIFAFDLDGTIVLSEGKALSAFGVKPGQLEGVNVWELYQNEPRILGDLKRAFAGETVRVQEATQSGWIESHFSPILDDQGRMCGVFSMATDVTGQKKAEKELGTYHLLVKAIIETSPDAIFIKDPGGRYLTINEAGARFLGKSVDEVVGKTDLELCPEHTAIEFMKSDQLALAAGRPRIEEETVVTGGVHRTYHSSKAPLKGPDGAPIGTLGIARDITERKMAENTLRLFADIGKILSAPMDLEALLPKLARAAVPLLADHCMFDIVEPSGKVRRLGIASCSPDFEETLRKMTALYPPTLDESSLAGRVLKSRQATFLPLLSEITIRAVTQDKAHYELLSSLKPRSGIAVPLFSRDRILGLIHLLVGPSGRSYDAADLSRAEELARRCGQAIDNALLFRDAQEALRNRDAFISVASHELKTPVTALKIQSALLRSGLSGPAGETLSKDRLAKLAEDADRQVDRILHMIRELFDISALQGGQIRLELEELDLCELAREAAQWQREDLERTGSELSIEACGPVVGSWDRTRLGQALSNLLGNAIKYGRGRPIRMRVELAGDRAAVLVSDRGIGIAAESMEEIFRPFQRIQAPGLRPVGLGLGLYVVSQVVKAHGGDLKVESVPGHGSTFRIELPLKPLQLLKSNNVINLDP